MAGSSQSGQYGCITMVAASFNIGWKRSTQRRKQRLYRYNAPLHIKQKMLHVHLSNELRKIYGLRNVQFKKGDKVKVLRGQFRKKEGKVEKVSLKKERVFITGLEYIKKEGAKVLVSFTPSNLAIIELDLADRKRKKKLESSVKSQETKSPESTKEKQGKKK